MSLHPDWVAQRQDRTPAARVRMTPGSALIKRAEHVIGAKHRKPKENAMSSILTNNSAMVALQTLKTVNNNLSKTQDMISTGKEIGKAKDNSTV